MKKALLGILVIIIIIAAIVYAVARHNSTNTSTSGTTANMPTMSAAPNSPHSAATTQAPQSSNSVVIENFAFSPSSLTVKKGTTVTWTNQDSTAHTVTENDNQNGPKSGELGKGQSYSFTYNTVGTFKYHCSIHPDMTGSVTVTE